MVDPEDLDAAWFGAVLAERYPDVRVAAVELVSVDEMTNTHVRASLTYDHAGGAPVQVFVKLPPLDPRRRQLLGTAGMGAKEARFYQRLAPELGLRVPTPHAALVEDDGGFAMVLEDLTATGCAPYCLDGVDADAAAGALEDLAVLHARYEDPGSRTGDDVSWITPPPRPTRPADGGLDLGSRLLRRGIDERRDRLGDAYVAVAEQYIAQREAVVELWTDAPPTVIHGDLHLGNLFADDGRVGFLDWGIVTLADPMRDVGYFLSLALDVEVRRARDRDLLRHYLDVRRALGAREIGWDEAWERYRIQSAYTVLASCQAIRVPVGADAQTHAIADNFLARAGAAVDDLEAAAAIGAA